MTELTLMTGSLNENSLKITVLIAFVYFHGVI